MKSPQLLSSLALSLILAPLATVAFTGSTPAAATPMATPAPDDTEDVLYLADGRVLRGNIVSEDRNEVVFQYIDRTLNMRATLKFRPDEIDRIDRDVPLDGAAPAATDTREPSRTIARPTSQPDEPERTYGTRRGDADDESLPSFYVVPMKGQMGTDVNLNVYEQMLDDIRTLDPDYLLIKMECRDAEDRLVNRIDNADQGLSGSTFLDEYREVVNLFHDELRDIPQILWIHDSLGISSVVALSWDNIYMKPEARLGGVAAAARNFGVADEEVRAKFREAYMAWLRGFVEYGNHDLDLMDAMVRPDMLLSASWKGREVEWSLDSSGQYLVDNDDEATVTFLAKGAEDFCISKGTAESLDDVALLHGIREYRVLNGQGDAIFEKYRDDWRRVFDNCKEWGQEFQKFEGWARGEDALKYLGRAKGMLEKILAAMDRYKAVELRMGMEYGVSRQGLIIRIEQMKEQIRALRSTGRGGGNAGGARGRGGSGPGAR